jgi:ABC-type phosphate/phosphonate transport system substrate-binding protein
MKRIAAQVSSGLLLGLVLLAAPAQADPASAKGAAVSTASLRKTTFSPTRQTGPSADAVAGSNTLIFTAPPRESEIEGNQTYQPIAEYLSKVTGRNIVYKHPGTWGVYRSEMLRGSYDLIFDGPHFNGYRSEKLNHNILVKAPEIYEFVIIARQGEKYTSAQQLIGRTVCTHAPPNLGALVLLNQFDNPARQPVIKSTEGWDNIYQGVVSGRCVAGVLPMVQLKKQDKNGHMKILYKTRAMPNQAFSASPRVPPEIQARIAKSLIAPEAAEPTARLRATFKVGPGFVSASNQEYAGLGDFLRNEWGYY